MTTAEAKALAPEFKARLGHALPLRAHLMVGGGECVVAHIPACGNHSSPWN